MAKRQNNPFHILGLRADALRGLNDQQLDEVVQSAHRALAKIHHPDKGGRADAFQKISWARQQVSLTSETLEHWKERFFRLRREHLSEAEAVVDHQREQLADDREQLLDFCRSLCLHHDPGVAHRMRNVRIML